MIIKTQAEHQQALLKILQASGQFDQEGLAYVADTLEAHFKNPDEAIWLTAIDGEPVGVAYCAAEAMTSGTWNLLMLWIKEGFDGQGFGKALVEQIEKELAHRQARLLIVETSQLPEFESARQFYARLNFTLEAEVKNFFDAGDNKLIYTKSLK